MNLQKGDEHKIYQIESKCCNSEFSKSYSIVQHLVIFGKQVYNCIVICKYYAEFIPRQCPTFLVFKDLYLCTYNMHLYTYLSKYIFVSVSACANFQKHRAHFSDHEYIKSVVNHTYLSITCIACILCAMQMLI